MHQTASKKALLSTPMRSKRPQQFEASLEEGTSFPIASHIQLENEGPGCNDETLHTSPTSPYHKMTDLSDLDADGSNMLSSKAIPQKKKPSDMATVSTVDDHSMSTDGTKGTILTVDEIGDTTGFAIICVVMFLGDMARGILFPTLWPLVSDLGGDERIQGIAVGAFSVGRIVSGPRFGSATVRFGYMRTLISSTLILFLGMFMYAQTCAVGTCWYLILSQVVTGYGSGTLGVTRAFVADVTPTRNRTTYMAYLTAMQYAGFTVTPLLGSAIVRLFDNDGDEYNGNHKEYKLG
jgi:hypothetical protein